MRHSLSLLLGCLTNSGELGELFERIVLEGRLAEGWRGIWSRTRPDGPGVGRVLADVSTGE